MLAAASAYWLLARALIAAEGAQALLAAAIGGDMKGKLSLLVYAAAIALAFLNAWIAQALFAAVALMWVIPDRRIERRIARGE